MSSAAQILPRPMPATELVPAGVRTSDEAVSQTPPTPKRHPADWLALKLWICAFVIMAGMNIWDAVKGMLAR